MPSMQQTETHFVTHDGLELYAQQWQPTVDPKAQLLVVHGVGEHSGRYADFAAWFVARGYAVHAFDHRGHGKSPGQRGHVDAWRDFREDVHAFRRQVQAQAPDHPTFLVGHSMGGLIVLDYGLHYGRGFAGVVASAPPLAWGESVSPLLISVGKLLSSVLPRLKMKSGLDPEDLSRDEAVVAAYRADPLVHGWVSPRFGSEMDRTMQRVMASASQWPETLPLLLLHGGGDPICPPQASNRFFELAGAHFKRRIEYPGLLHEVFNELGREQVLADVQAWLDEHLV